MARKPSRRCYRTHAQVGTPEEWELGHTEVPDHGPQGVIAAAAAVVVGRDPQAFQPCEGASVVHDQPAFASAEASEEGSGQAETSARVQPALVASSEEAFGRDPAQPA
ncbi:hypothetical protein PG991_000934 [Apiospora marii]|uniref:Uncharacterized protein n=1 Tax=Apiospora marii TaxID=335849 RepID=A0ABR1STE6_9PEZI